MRRMFITAVTAAMLALAGGGASASQAVARPDTTARPEASPVQYRPDWHARREWDRPRWHHREQRRAYERERIEEAARREARRIEREREHRRAWRYAQRERHFRHHDGF